jgi:hypothetical protein
MEKEDFRSLGRDPQEALRVRAVQLVRTVGKTQAEAVESVGVQFAPIPDVADDGGALRLRLFSHLTWGRFRRPE